MIKRIGTCMVTAILLITMLSVSVSASSTMATRCNVRLRKQASTTSDTLTTLSGGTEVQVLGTSGSWTKVSYGGYTGYVSTQYLMELTKSGYYPLREGDESPYVKELQKRLAELGYFTETADGKYDVSTTQAVKSFQKANGMSQDGMAGGQTQKLLYSDSAKAASGTVSSSSTTSETTGSSTTGTTTTATASATTLKVGDRGDDVKTLQARLIELGYLSGKADGIFGTSTQNAVIAFQKRSSLTADGKAGKVTQNLLYSNAALSAEGTTTSSSSSTTSDTTGASATTYTTLKKGMTSNAVKTLQNKLKDLGYLSSSATGYYGTQTKTAVESFQKANGLTADGIAGTLTQQVLYGSSAVYANSGSSASSGSSSNKTYTTLKEGMKSSDVTTMQKKLISLGYLSSTATGYFGSATKTAVTAFQKANSLTADGVAGNATLNKLYSDSAIAKGASSSSSGGSTTGTGKISGPSSSSVKLLHWFNSVKPSLKSNSVLQIYDPATGYGYKLRALSLGRHLDCEPLTAEDTQYMNAAFGGVTTWTPKVVWVQLPSGTWTMATMHNTPHLSGSIANNNFDGHLCVHFLRDMDEVSKNDPNYGVTNQKALRAGWKTLTGETVN